MDTETFEVGSNWVKNPHRDLRDIEREFDLAADQYEACSAEWDYRGATDGPAFVAQHLPRDGRILDAGCGTGLIGAALAARGYRDLTGIDISAGMLNRARARAGVYSGGLVKADLCSMPFPEASFDAVVCIAVLTYAPSIERIFTEFERVTRLGGILAFSHRIDLETDCGFAEALIARLLAEDWSLVAVTEPMLLLPSETRLRRRRHRSLPRLPRGSAPRSGGLASVGTFGANELRGERGVSHAHLTPALPALSRGQAGSLTGMVRGSSTAPIRSSGRCQTRRRQDGRPRSPLGARPFQCDAMPCSHCQDCRNASLQLPGAT